MATTFDQLQAMLGLKENWDGYGAAAPNAAAVELARGFVGLLEQQVKKSANAALHLSPTRIGGVLIEWEDNANEHELEIDPYGSLGFLHRDKTTGQIATRRSYPFAPIRISP
jgi:hypothetical protein